MSKTSIYATKYGTFAVEREGALGMFSESPTHFVTYHRTIEEARAELEDIRYLADDPYRGRA